jgi:YggT family protein
MDVMQFLNSFIQIYIYLIIARVLLSWFPVPRNDLLRSAYKIVYDVTEPYLSLFRRIIPSIGGGGMGIDISPMIAIIVLIAVQSFLGRL